MSSSSGTFLGCLVTAAFINGYAMGTFMGLKGFPEKRLGSYGIAFRPKKKVNGIDFFINGSVEINPFSVQFDIRLIHPPTAIHRLLPCANFIAYQASKASHLNFGSKSCDIFRTISFYLLDLDQKYLPESSFL